MTSLKTRFLCWRFGHHWHFVETLAPNTVRLGCENCHHEVAYNAAARLEVPWKKVATWYRPDGILKPEFACHPVLTGTSNPLDPEDDRFCNHRMEP